MDLRQLRTFVAIVDEGSFTAAARTLFVAQPSASQTIKALEIELGARLFDRIGRAVRLTAAGEALIGPARQMLRDAATARSAVDAVTGLHAGRLDLVCLPTLAVWPASQLIGRFRHHHPGVVVTLSDPLDAAGVADRLRHGTSEVGLSELPGDIDLTSHVLEQHDFVAVLSPEADAADHDRPMSLAALAALPLVLTPSGTSTRRQVDDAFAAANLLPTLAVETDHRESIPALVLAGAGAAILPRPAAVLAARQGLVMRDVRPAITRTVGLVHRKGPLSPAAQAFVAMTLAARDQLAVDASAPTTAGRSTK